MAAMIIQSFHCVHDSIQVFLKAIFQKLLNGFRVSKIQNFKNLKLVFAMDLSLAPKLILNDAQWLISQRFGYQSAGDSWNHNNNNRRIEILTRREWMNAANNGSVIKVNWTLMTSRNAGANGVSTSRKA